MEPRPCVFGCRSKQQAKCERLIACTVGKEEERSDRLAVLALSDRWLRGFRNKQRGGSFYLVLTQHLLGVKPTEELSRSKLTRVPCCCTLPMMDTGAEVGAKARQ